MRLRRPVVLVAAGCLEALADKSVQLALILSFRRCPGLSRANGGAGVSNWIEDKCGSLQFVVFAPGTISSRPKARRKCESEVL